MKHSFLPGRVGSHGSGALPAGGEKQQTRCEGRLMPRGRTAGVGEGAKPTSLYFFFSQKGLKQEVFRPAVRTARLQKKYCSAWAVMFVASVNPWHGLRLRSGLFLQPWCAFVGFTFITMGQGPGLPPLCLRGEAHLSPAHPIFLDDALLVLQFEREIKKKMALRGQFNKKVIGN